jgi:hypothetical protein
MYRAIIFILLVLTLPSPLLAANIALTLSSEDKVNKGEAVLTLNERLKLFYEEARNYEDGTKEVLKGITINFNFDWKIGER